MAALLDQLHVIPQRDARPCSLHAMLATFALLAPDARAQAQRRLPI